MPEITVNVGVSVRSDGGGTGHNWDRTSLNAAQQLFREPIRIGMAAEPYTVRVNPIPVPRGFSGTIVDRKPVLTPSEPKNPAKESDLHRERASFDFRLGQESLAGIDLLYVPGAAAATPTQSSDRWGMKPDDARKTAEADSRNAFERALIDKAMTMGIPVLAVCAGSWRLLEAFGGSVRELTSEEVRRHHLLAFDVTEVDRDKEAQERKQARRLKGEEMMAKARERYGEDASVWSLSHSLRVHQGPGGAVRSAATRTARDLLGTSRDVLDRSNVLVDGANSTHWAVGESTASTRGAVGTLAQHEGATVDPSTLLSIVASDPDTGVMEGFETIHGAPMVGAQWHPEGYLEGQPGVAMPYTRPGIVSFSRNLFHYMILAAVTAKLRKAGVVEALRAAGPLRHVREEAKAWRDAPFAQGRVL